MRVYLTLFHAIPLQVRLQLGDRAEERQLWQLLELDPLLAETCLGRKIVNRRLVDSPVWTTLDNLTDQVSE